MNRSRSAGVHPALGSFTEQEYRETRRTVHAIGATGAGVSAYHRFMKKHTFRHFVAATMIAISSAATLAQQGSLSAADKQRRIDTEAELQSLAVVERKVMMPMPDGVRL